MESIWHKHTSRVTFEPLNGDKRTDVLVIGGGIAGTLCTHALCEAGVDCLLVEADRIGGGNTQNTTAKITVEQRLIYNTMRRRFGDDTTRRYLEAQTQALEDYARLCRGIDCDFEVKDAIVYSLEDRRKVEKEITALQALGIDAEFLSATALPFPVAGAVCVRNQAQFHPLKFLYAIADGLPIYEHTKVTQLMPHQAITNHGKILYKKLIVATHFPIDNKHGAYALKLYQHRSYVLALKGASLLNGMYVDDADTGLSFRTYQDHLLIGGGGHRTGKTGGCWQELERFVETYYPDAKVVDQWAAQDCMTLDDLPYIGRYSKRLPDVFVATGFNKWGMTNAMAAAKVLCDLIQGKQNRFDDVFSPSRNILRPQLAVNAFETTVGLLTPTVPRCPHLGCALKYNAAEHSWDCPCHGSRFTEQGKLIDNPATDDKQL